MFKILLWLSFYRELLVCLTLHVETNALSIRSCCHSRLLKRPEGLIKRPKSQDFTVRSFPTTSFVLTLRGNRSSNENRDEKLATSCSTTHIDKCYHDKSICNSNHSRLPTRHSPNKEFAMGSYNNTL